MPRSGQTPHSVMSGVLARCHQTLTQHFHHFLGRGPALLLSRSSHRHSSPGGSTPNEDTHLHPSVTPLCGVIKSYQATFIAPHSLLKRETRRSEIEQRRRPDWCRLAMHSSWKFEMDVLCFEPERGDIALLHCTFCSVLNLSLIQFDLYWKIILSACGWR